SESTTGYLRAGDASPVTYTRTLSYDARHRLLGINGPRDDINDVTSHTYYSDSDANINRRGREQQYRDAVGLITSSDDYDLYGTARTAIDANGVRVLSVTDARGRKTSTTNKAVAGDPNEPADYVQNVTWDGRDRMTAIQNARGITRRFAYEEGTNRRTDTIQLDAAGNEVEREHFTLNTVGDRALEEDQSCASPAPVCTSWITKRSVSYVYDTHNRVSQRVRPDGAKRIFTWNADGLLGTVQDENHSSVNTRYTYDALHRLTAAARALGGGEATTRYTYDAHDNTSTTTDPNGNVTTWAYDDFDRVQTQSGPVTGATSYSYDPAGNLLTVTDANGDTTTRTYDANNRLLTSASSRSGAPTETTTWTHDGGAASAYAKG